MFWFLPLLLCLTPQTTANPDEPTVTRIWDGAPHCAFPDIVRWNDAWYVTCREGTGHVPGDNGSNGVIRVIRSEDGLQWTSFARITETGIDLRDPKLSIAPDGRLMLLMGGSLYEGRTRLSCRTRVAFLDRKTQVFSMPIPVRIDETIRTQDDWLWRVTWHDGSGYGVVYQPDGEGGSRTHLVRTTNGVDYEHVTTFALEGRPNESTVRFAPDGEAFVVVRNEKGPGHLGRAPAPYTHWAFQSVGWRLGGPNLIRTPQGTWILGTRDSRKRPAHTAIGTLSEEAVFTPRFVLPSGGDTSYPGFAIADEELFTIYYSSHEGRTAIYLARCALAAFE